MPKIETDNGALHYEILDATPPWLDTTETILFHHGVAIDSGIWAGWPPSLSDRYRLVTFDVRGYGRSNIPDDGFDWSFEVLAKDVLAVADAADAETLPRFRAGTAVDNKRAADFDPVTEADRGAERAILSAIAARYPDHAVLGEEFGASGNCLEYSWRCSGL